VGLAARLRYRLIGRFTPTHAKRTAKLAYWRSRQAVNSVDQADDLEATIAQITRVTQAR
jgi:hypothetical protein